MKDRIRQLMDAQQMNQQTFASRTGIGSASLSSIFTGRTRPTLNHVDAIIDTFPNVNPMWLLKGIGGMFLTSDEMAAASNTDSMASAGGEVPGVSQPHGGDLFSSANMSVEPSLFNTPSSPVGGAVPTPSQNRNSPTSFHFSTEKQVIPTPPRKITEIRIFYDDQTWESFVPKK